MKPVPAGTAGSSPCIAELDTKVFVSTVSAWEIVTKFRLGKLSGARTIVDDLGGVIAAQSFAPLPVAVLHAQRAGALPGPHRDPFDRMLIAQAHVEGLLLVSNEKVPVPALPFAHLALRPLVLEHALDVRDHPVARAQRHSAEAR